MFSLLVVRRRSAAVIKDASLLAEPRQPVWYRPLDEEEIPASSTAAATLTFNGRMNI